MRLHIKATATEWLQLSNTTQEIKELGPIIEAEPIKFSFDTPGWYMLGVCLLIIAVLVAVQQIKKYRANAYRREALKKLNKLNSDLLEETKINKLTSLLAILKIVAIEAYGRKEVAHLYGKTWLEFLDSKIKDNSFLPFEAVINKMVYEGTVATNEEFHSLHAISINWIRKHA